MITLTAQKINCKLKNPPSISFGTTYYAKSVIVTLSYKGKYGLGEATPFSLVTGDSQEDILEEVKHFSSLPIDPEQDSLEKMNHFLKMHIKSTTLRAAIDFAYHDLLGKYHQIPAYQLYASKFQSVKNSITLFLHDNIEDTITSVKEIYQRYPHLQLLKIKLKGERDIERAQAIRDHSPENMQFIVDANQGFSDPEIAIQTLKKIQRILGNLYLVEEPCPMKDLVKLKKVKDGLTSLPVFADESAVSYEDVEKLITSQSAQGINIKLQKTGGITEAKRIAKLCQQHGLSIMVGCMFEGPIGIAAGITFAVTTPGVILTDLDFDLEIPQYTNHICPFVNGERIPLSQPGFGIAIDGKNKPKSIELSNLIDNS